MKWIVEYTLAQGQGHKITEPAVFEQKNDLCFVYVISESNLKSRMIKNDIQ